MSKERIDTDRLLADADIITIINNHVPLKKKGTEWVGICPFHDDTKASLQVNRTKQVYGCFACGAGGDAIDFLMRLGATFKDACNEIAGGDINAPKPVEKRKAKEATKVKEWKQAKPTEAPGQISHYRHGKPSRLWPYRNRDGITLGYICRFDLPDGSKEVLPFIYATDGNRTEWRWQGFDKPRPMYNLDKLAANPSAPVLVVEGEKTADAAAALFPKHVVTCWQGGAKAIQHTDWTALSGRKIILWPDNDRPGDDAMHDIADIIRETAAGIRWVLNPADAPKHWDVADADWTPEQAQEFVKANLVPVPDRLPPEMEIEHEPELPPAPPPPAINSDDLPPSPAHHEAPFRILGYSKEGDSTRYHFFGHASRTVISLSAGQLAKNNLLQLAPLNYWEGEGLASAGKFKNERIANQLINECVRAGYFSDKNIRGRGAWMDSDSVVIHTGDKLVVNGQHTDLANHQTRFIYERNEPIGFYTVDPLQNAEAGRLIDILKLLNWDREVNAYLLAGWCVVAPICGCLNWRPHIWITGAAGTGKSWVFKNIVRPMLGETALAVQSETTEPGLRQLLGNDALPVVFDEAEGETKQAQERMQSVLTLMRAASADDGGIMAKGTSSGAAKTYRIRSCFAFASIAYQVAQQSDRTRVTVLGLRLATDSNREARWKELQREYIGLVTNEWVRRLQARTVSLIPVILDNARTFAAAAASVIGEQRAGDQLGALLAGAYSLTSRNRIDMQSAIDWVSKRDWNEERGLDTTRDEYALLNYLLQQTISLQTIHSRYERTVAEAVAIALNWYMDGSDITSEGALTTLRRFGFKMADDMLIISNTSDWIMKKLANTQWAKNHYRILERIPGSKRIETTRFGPGQGSRAVAVPLALLRDEA